MPTTGCIEKTQESGTIEALPVKVGVAVMADVPVEKTALGTVEAYSTVDITSHITGQIMQVHVKEGQDLQKGQLLFEIDDRAYQASLESAKATLAQDLIKLEKEKLDAQRYAELLKKDYVTKDEAEQAQNDVEVREAAIKGDEAAIKTAELNLSYCRITAPIAGRAGAILVNQGNIITANNSSSPLMVINQIRPIFVKFSVPEQYLPEIQAKLNADDPTAVKVSLPESPEKVRAGGLTFINNSIDTDTGTIELKASFDNRDNSLWPGQFVNVTLILGINADAIVVPSGAVQMGQDGNYVFVMKPDNTVESRNVKVGFEMGDKTEIMEGIFRDEVVVTEGQLKLSPGARVSVKDGTQTGSEVTK